MVDPPMTKAAKPQRPSRPARLPGDPDAATAIEQMVRVNQAGEYGAKRIYQGQLAVLGKSEAAPILTEMLAQEEQHLARFNEIAARRGVRPTVLEPLWHVAGFALGAATAAIGKDAAMACTVAVEDVIGEHYAEQSAQLGDDEADLRATIDAFRRDELHHRDVSLKAGAEQAPGYEVLTAAIKAGTRLAIWLSKKI
ncbi:MAG: demethoxyubiquinone hydroxylase family protein [Rhodobacteraceae bacterium]|nr:demethoxyubiquinone hydroxylase family protein [Paracoccaceae bacterium]